MAEAGDRIGIRTTRSGTHEYDLQGVKSGCARVEQEGAAIFRLAERSYTKEVWPRR